MQQVKGDANPFDPEYQDYFEQRKTKRMLESFNGKRSLVQLWKRQNGICPLCNTPIDESIAWSVLRETQVNGNRHNQLVHMKCRRQQRK